MTRIVVLLSSGRYRLPFEEATNERGQDRHARRFVVHGFTPVG
jgi:hypothetical protein